MKYVRPYVDEAEKTSYPARLLDADGKRLCVGRGCGKLLVGRQERWCSPKCVADALATYDWTTARKRALRRDGFTCVECAASGKKPPYVDLEVDHIIPLVEGGKLCDPANLRTLCRDCHKIHTLALRKRLRAAKSPREGASR